MTMAGNNDKKWFSDEKGRKSSGRLMAFLALLTAMALALGDLVIQWQSKVEANPDTDTIILTFLVAAFGGKVGQKFAEKP